MRFSWVLSGEIEGQEVQQSAGIIRSWGRIFSFLGLPTREGLGHRGGRDFKVSEASQLPTTTYICASCLEVTRLSIPCFILTHPGTIPPLSKGGNRGPKQKGLRDGHKAKPTEPTSHSSDSTDTASPSPALICLALPLEQNMVRRRGLISLTLLKR